MRISLSWAESHMTRKKAIIAVMKSAKATFQAPPLPAMSVRGSRVGCGDGRAYLMALSISSSSSAPGWQSWRTVRRAISIAVIGAMPFAKPEMAVAMQRR